MFGFPVNLQDSGVQKLTYDADNGFQKTQRREIFYSVKNGSWFDLNVWQTASGNAGKLPGPDDDVFVRHSVAFGNQVSYSVRNLYVTGNLTLPQYTFFYVNNYKAPGTTTFDAGSSLVIYGQDNLINNIVGDSIVYYAANVDQEILNIDYYKLHTAGTGVKYLTKNLYLTKAGGIDNQGIMDLKGYELFVTGTFSNGLLYQGGSGKITFAGLANVSGPTFQLYGNPNVEFRNGLNIVGGGAPMNTGTGTWTFTTNNQQINVLYHVPTFNCKIVYDNITLTWDSGTNSSFAYFNDTLNGTTPSSNFISKGQIGFNTIASLSSFSVGTYDLLTFNTSITNFSGNYSTTIPANLIGYSLKVEGTGTKTMPSTQTIQGTLNLNGGNLEVSTFNLTINGATTLQGLLSKSGSGNIVFGGLVSSFGNVNSIDFTIGNPNVELKNGLNMAYKPTSNIKTGTGIWTFTTNNQSIAGPNTYAFSCSMLIAPGITLTIPSADATEVWLYNAGGINGQSATSTLINNSVIDFQVANCVMMSTGIFNPIGNLNSTIRYSSTTTESLHFVDYPKLTISNGIKNAVGNTTINSTLRFPGSGQLAMTTFDLSVLGQTLFPDYSVPTGDGYITKTGAGNVLFVGSLIMGNTWRAIAFQTGNPNVELRNGIIGNAFAGTIDGAFQTINTGTGVWSFTTNNQSIGTNTYSASKMDFDCEILISGAITLSINATSTFTLSFNKLINGNNASSQITFSANNVVTYKAATQPMATGILDTFTNANTWIYGNANQDIKGGPTTGAKQVYRNLTLNGGGTKTLQGYVSVLNTYTLTSPATLANNGFTLTNP